MQPILIKRSLEPNTVPGVWGTSVSHGKRLPAPADLLSLTLCLPQSGYAVNAPPHAKPGSLSHVTLPCEFLLRQKSHRNGLPLPLCHLLEFLRTRPRLLHRTPIRYPSLTVSIAPPRGPIPGCHGPSHELSKFPLGVPHVPRVDDPRTSPGLHFLFAKVRVPRGMWRTPLATRALTHIAMPTDIQHHPRRPSRSSPCTFLRASDIKATVTRKKPQRRLSLAGNNTNAHQRF